MNKIRDWELIMNKKVGFVSSVIVASLLSACGGVRPDVEESDNFIDIGGIEFRKKGSTNAAILYAGVRREGWVDTFDPKFLPVLSKEIRARQVTRVFNNETGRLAFESAASAGINLSNDSNSATAAVQSNVTGKYSVFTLFDVNDFVAELNSDANKKNLALLKRYEDPRIITSIATVFDRESSKKFGALGRLSLNITNPATGNPVFNLKSEVSGDSVATLSNGTVFAYEYARLCWEKVNDKVRVATIEVDRPGLDGNCPAGTKETAADL